MTPEYYPIPGGTRAKTAHDPDLATERVIRRLTTIQAQPSWRLTLAQIQHLPETAERRS